MMARKDQVVKQNNEGLSFLMKKNKVTVIRGTASFKNKEILSIQGPAPQEITAKHFIIATGSKPSGIKGIEIDNKRIISSTGALKLQEIPGHLLIIGGGVIGLELGSVYARLGSKISVIEFTDAIIGTMDRSLGKELQKVLQKEGFQFFLNHRVTSAQSKGKTVTVKAQDVAGKEVSFEGDYCLVATGRKPYTENLGLDKAGIGTDAQGRITVDENLQTTAKGIYAIGDVIRGAMLAHKAEEEGVFVAEIIAGQKPHINYLLIPGVVYTWPEVASVGYTEEELKSKNAAYKTGSFPFKASGRARASMDTDGFIKVLADQNTDELLGVHMIGPRAADLIAEAVVALEFRASAEDIARISHAHPTYTEAFKEACLMATGNRAIHI
jgi:dihydrolipoamide dehydrogenase